MNYNEKTTRLLQSLEALNRIALEHKTKSRTCSILERLFRRLLELSRDVFVIFNREELSNDGLNILSELSWQLRSAKGLVIELGTQPQAYRNISAVRNRAKCLQVCRSIGLSLEGLKSIWDQSKALEESTFNVLEQLSQTANAFQNSEFSLQHIDTQFFQVTQEVSTKVFDGKMTHSDGLFKLKEIVERIVDLDKIKESWKKLALLLFRDIDRARCRNDAIEEFSLRLLFWTLNGGPSAPPPEFLCPLTLQIMQQPVILCESEITYERKAISSMLSKDDIKRCPVSLKKLTNATLAENKSLKMLISDWLRAKTLLNHIKSGTTSERSKASSLVKSVKLFVIEELCQSPINVLCHRIESHPVALVTTPRDFTSSVSYSDNSTLSAASLNSQLQLQDVLIIMTKAAENGNVALLEEIHGQGWTLKEQNENGEDCLIIACIHGQKEVVKYILDKGISPNESKKVEPVGGCTPLILASSNGHAECVNLLLDAGANLTNQDERGWTALHAACDNGHLEPVKCLVRFGIEYDLDFLHIRTEMGWTALHNAVRYGDIEIVDTLLNVSSDVNVQCHSGWSPLHIAVELSHIKLVQKLLRFPNLQINIKSKDGWTALHAAVDQDNIDIAKLLLQSSIDVNASSDDGISALHRAAYSNKLEFGKLLVEKGKADLNLKTKLGRKAIQLAGEKGNYDFYNYLHWKSLQYLFRKKKSKP